MSDCYPAGTDDTSFSVKGRDIVITYGGITSGSGVAEAKRYLIVVLQLLVYFNDITIIRIYLAFWPKLSNCTFSLHLRSQGRDRHDC